MDLSFHHILKSFSIQAIAKARIMSSQYLEKQDPNRAETLEVVKTQYERDEIAHLSPEHREYLLNKHGHLDLGPVPDMNDADPYNWSSIKV